MLRANDMIPRESTLSKSEVESLTESLNVDFLIALENIQIRSLRKIEYLREWGVYAGTIDVKVYPTVKVYLPNRNGPMVTINTNDSIFWDYAAPSIAQAGAGLISETEMLKEASEFAGTVPVKYMLPHWKTASRYLFTSGSVMQLSMFVKTTGNRLLSFGNRLTRRRKRENRKCMQPITLL